MEILLLPMLVFIFVVVVIVLYNRLSKFRTNAEKSWQTLQLEVKKQQEVQKINDNSSRIKVENARLDYNKKAASYNKLIQTFPLSIMAAMAGDKEREVY